MAVPAEALDEGPSGDVGKNPNVRGLSGERGCEINEDSANDGASVDQRSSVVMTWAGLEDEIVILAAVIAAAVIAAAVIEAAMCVAAVHDHVAVANLLGIH